MSTPRKKDQVPSQMKAALSSPILQADELCFNPRWSPHLKSPRPSSTISSRLRQLNSPLGNKGRTQPPSLSPFSASSTVADADGSHTDDGGRGAGTMTSPLSKRARILQNDSPVSLPPLSPVVSSRKRSIRGDLAHDSPLPFSPTASGLRIRYSPSSPMSPTLRVTPHRGEPESPTLSRMLAKDSPTLSLYEKLASTSGSDEESPTVSQMSRSLLFRLDLESPTGRRAAGAADSPLAALEKAKMPITSPLALQFSPIPLPIATDDTAGPDLEDEASMPIQKRQMIGTARRPSVSIRDAPITLKLEQRRRKLANAAPVTVPQIYVSPLRPRMDQGIERIISAQLEQARRHFDSSFGAREADFTKVTEECGLPRFANRALFRYVTRDASGSSLTGSTIIGKRARLTDREVWPSFSHFCNVWARLRRSSADIHALLFIILTDDASQPRSYLTRADIKPLVTDVVDNHFELEFLEGQGQFAQSYTETVIERIFYNANRTWDGKMTLSQFRKADIAGTLRTIEGGIDVDIESPGIFSYKHFYVLFCSFFELDSNRDRLLDARDLLRYFSGTLSRRTISRIMMGKGKPSEHITDRAAAADDPRAKAKADKRKAKAGSRYDLNVRLSDCRMTYCDFIWFLLSEIDKTSPTAIEYWFRCLDLDGDGVLTVYELEYFYDEQYSRMEEEMSGDVIMLDDLMCQLNDLICPEKNGLITLKDLRRAPPKMLPIFFDAFMNLTRFLEHDSRTSFLQRQLAQLSMRAMPATSFKDVIQMRIDFLASLPNPWIEFADCEYAALLNDHEEQESQEGPAEPAQTITTTNVVLSNGDV
ncbi:Serine/threonine-protein phosphatase 2A regulatory subunit B'' subunit alpha [Coemansia aciculifera]|uniref:Serine/threonine-protein phosphatase 2A regulatory subunit B'' subunit alpha n=1 Tax=Coemansia aciculifera TaxID=417176 RepID=A0A9W8M955_9FUNG|nr:Serine/threonine-protein phosphatase 2A regulatory subunit B'' subunit alpha [Coemansia aciculifera]KAJ2874909.1 Serine/threonine-protein phosphatase 2A regulatory subunit B'' subunit alpha [Coemansia aciculifera]